MWLRIRSLVKRFPNVIESALALINSARKMLSSVAFFGFLKEEGEEEEEEKKLFPVSTSVSSLFPLSLFSFLFGSQQHSTLSICTETMQHYEETDDGSAI